MKIQNLGFTQAVTNYKPNVLFGTSLEDKPTIDALQRNTLTHYHQSKDLNPDETTIGQLFLKNEKNHSSKVLEIGSGAGRFLTWLMDKGHNVQGIDPWQNAVNQTILQFPKLKDCYQVGYLSQIDKLFPNEQFDVIFIPGTLQHLPNRQAVKNSIDLIQQKLKPGGRLYYSMTDYRSRYLNQESRDRIGRFYLKITTDEISDLLKEKGFRFVDELTDYSYDRSQWISQVFENRKTS